MDNIIYLEQSPEPAIQIERTEEFLSTAKELSRYLHDLPLTNEQNDPLVALMVKHVQAAEQGAFLHGFRVSAQIGPKEDGQ